MILPYHTFYEVISQNIHIYGSTILHSPYGRTQKLNILRPAIFWDCVQHKMLIPFQRFRITNRSHLQGSRCPSRTCLGSMQLAHTGCVLEELTVTELI